MARASSSTLVIRPVPPFRLDLTAWALRRRARNAIDRWDGDTYRRVVIIGSRATELAVRQLGPPASPRLVVTTTPALRTDADRRLVRSTLQRALGADVDLAGWYRVAGGDARLGPLADRFRGMKPPRFPTIFEAVVNAFACQQLSLIVGLELLNRLAARCGTRHRTLTRDQDAFPGPDDLARLPAARYRALGFSHQKAQALVQMARAVAAGDLDLEHLARAEPEDARARLLELRGVGRWSAEYVLLRGLGRLDVFPGDDVGAQKSLARWLGRAAPLDYAGVTRAVSRWQPYAGMVYFHLLLDGLARAGTAGLPPA